MKYQSTRGQEKGLSFERVLFAGYAKDLGLYMPESVPRVTAEEFSSWGNLSYKHLVYEVIRKFISADEIADQQLRDVVESSFARFDHPNVIGTKNLPCNLSVFELYHGPTFAFKDLALCVVAGLIEYFLKKKRQHFIALVGTSGDTGSSAMESVRGRENIDIIVLFPKGRCSDIQRRQMTTINEQNTHLFCVDGTSDDLDVPIKQCFEDKDFAVKHKLLSMNSINVCRILVQIPIYIYTYYRLAQQIGDEVEIVVPTGGAGSITAGCLAHKMGFPVRLTAAVNVNDCVAQFLRNGSLTSRAEVQKTFSCAMDIQMAWNLERVAYTFSDQNCSKVKFWMDEFEREKEVKLPEDTIRNIQKVVKASHVSSDEDVIRVIQKVKKEFDYYVCPHTATALSYCFSQPSAENIPRGVLATASPEKFSEAVAAAGFHAPMERVRDLLKKEESFQEMAKDDNWLKILQEKIVSITQKRQN